MTEIRSLFLSSHALAQRAETFVKQRLVALAEKPIIPLDSGGQAVIALHLIPLNSLAINQTIDPVDADLLADSFAPMELTSYKRLMNLRGLLLYHGSKSSCDGYTQIYRDCCVESVSSWATLTKTDGQKVLPGKAIARQILDATCSYMDGLQKIETSPPVLVSISFLGMQLTRLETGSIHDNRTGTTYDDENIILPSVTINSFGNRASYSEVIHKSMNVLWNAFNYRRCTLFDDEGHWTEED